MAFDRWQTVSCLKFTNIDLVFGLWTVVFWLKYANMDFDLRLLDTRIVHQNHVDIYF